MASPTTKQVAQTILDESMGFAFDELFPNSQQEAGPVAGKGKVQSFDMLFYRQRGHPKKYKITVEEIH